MTRLISIYLTLFTTSLQAHTLVDIYDLARSNDPEFLSRQASISAVEEVEQLTRAALFPSLSISMDGRQVNSRTNSTQIGTDISAEGFPQSARSVTQDTYNTHGAGLDLSQPILDMERWHAFRQGKVIGQRQDWERRGTEQALMLRVAQLYTEALKANVKLDISQQELTALKYQQEQVERLRTAGLVSNHDVLDIRAVLDRADVERMKLEHRLHAAMESLMGLSGQPVLITMTNSLTSITENDLDAEREPPLRENNDLVLADFETKTKLAALSIHKAEYWPKLRFLASYRRNVTPRGGYEQTADTAFIGLNLEMNLFQGGATLSRIREATYQLEEAKETLAVVRRDTQNKINILRRKLSSNLAAMTALRRLIESQSSALTAAQAGYRAGERSLLDVLQVQTGLFRTKAELHEAQFDHIVDWLEFRRAVGLLDRSDLVRVSGN